MAKKTQTKTVRLVCPVCGTKFQRVPYEVKRNKRLGRMNLCGRSCHAVYMNMSPAKKQEVSDRMQRGQAGDMNEARWRAYRRKKAKRKKSKTRKTERKS